MTETLTIGDLTLNPQEFTVRRGTASITLSQKEFMLLEYLMRNAQKVVSKDQIIAHVWNYDADILPNTVEVYIRNLRTKIDLPFSSQPQLIHTVRGFGYKME
jgi:DNA-binding response OmpR family regulator